MESIEVIEGLTPDSQIVTGPYDAISKNLDSNSKIYVIEQQNKSKEKKIDDKKGKK